MTDPARIKALTEAMERCAECGSALTFSYASHQKSETAKIPLRLSRALSRRKAMANCARTHAHSNLNIFHAIVAILEGGVIYGAGNGSARKTADRIIAICKAEAARQLDIYDRVEEGDG